MKSFAQRFQVQPGSRVRLKDHDAGWTGDWDKEGAAEEVKKHAGLLGELQYKLYAESSRSLLIVLQGMDTGGKDGAIRHVMSAMNPESCRVVPFKQPTRLELAHDFLWRIHRQAPARGEVVIFNRSHYEDVLVVRVHNLVPRSIWSRRYDEINRFERYLADNGTTIVKFFVHISKDEQKKRLEKRLTDPTKHWKIEPADVQERKYWNDYVRAYEEALSRCSTPWAPWFILPANKKWFRNLVVSRILVETLKAMNPRFPKPKLDLKKLKVT